MAYDERLAERIRHVLGDRRDVVEKKMFGGLAFMVAGNMCIGVAGEDLMARIGPDRYPELVEMPHARPMDFTGKPLRGFVYVEPAGIDKPGELRAWVERALAFVDELPAK